MERISRVTIISTTVRLPLDLRRQAELEADLQGQTYSSFMRSLLVAYLRQAKERKLRNVDAKTTQ